MSAATAVPTRDRYIDSLRCVALIRVVAFHTFGWAWLPIVFPSMGVMFALAGALVAASLDRAGGNYLLVIRKRITRLLPPLWALGIILVPVMIAAGWTHSSKQGAPLEWQSLLLWVLPLADPPGSELGADWVLPLWYIRTYLWLVLLSPALLWLFRRWPVKALLAPPLLVFTLAAGLLTFTGVEGEILLALGTYAACWMLGFAHHDNLIRPFAFWKVAVVATLLVAVGVVWTVTHPDPESGPLISDIPVANTLYSLGFVLLLLRVYPDFAWVARHQWLDRLIAAINRRAMTIYLWGNVAIYLAIEVVSRYQPTSHLMAQTPGDGGPGHRLRLDLGHSRGGRAGLRLGRRPRCPAAGSIEPVPTPPGESGSTPPVGCSPGDARNAHGTERLGSGGLASVAHGHLSPGVALGCVGTGLSVRWDRMAQ